MNIEMRWVILHDAEPVRHGDVNMAAWPQAEPNAMFMRLQVRERVDLDEDGTAWSPWCDVPVESNR